MHAVIIRACRTLTDHYVTTSPTSRERSYVWHECIAPDDA